MFKNTLLLILFSNAVIAESHISEKNKRPSWSQGMPERQKSPNLAIPKADLKHSTQNRDFVNEIKNESVDRSFEFELEPLSIKQAIPSPNSQTQATNLQQSHQSKLNSAKNNSVVTTTSTPPPKQHTTEVKIKDTPTDNFQGASTVIKLQEKLNNETIEIENAVVQPKTAANKTTADNAYNWQIHRQLPVEVPGMLLAKQNTVLVKISINNKGQVTEIESVTSNSSPSLINHVKRSVNKWRFAPPVEQGISDRTLSRVFKVSLTART